MNISISIINTYIKIRLILRDIPVPGLQGIVGGADVVVADGQGVVTRPVVGHGHAQGHRVVAPVTVRVLAW